MAAIQHNLIRFWRILRPHRWLIGLLCICFICNQATTVVVPLAIGATLDRIIPSHDRAGLNVMLAVLVGILLLKVALIFFERELSVRSGWLIVRDVRTRLHAHFLKMSLRFLDEYQVGRIVSRIMGDTECMRNLLTGVINSSASAVRCAFVFGTLLFLDWRLALASCAVLPLFFVGFWTFANSLKPAYRELNEAGARLFSGLNEIFSGVRVVKTYCGERRANRGFLSHTHEILRQSLLVSRTQHLITIVWEATAWCSLIVLIWYGGQRVMAGALTIGELVAFYGLLGQMQGPIADLVNINASLQPALASIEQIEQVFHTEPEITDRAGAVEAGTLRGEIEFKDVEFTYKRAESEAEDTDHGVAPRRYTLQGISCRVQAGQRVAVVGASGSGKSTLLNLLARLYDVDKGSITVDGVDIRTYRLRSYLKNFAIVLQDNFLFRGTIRDNIRYARWDAPEQEIIRAARLAGAWQFISRLEHGLDACCAERGVSLSGGQRQRLALARAIVADPRILILDEATSAVDNRTEMQIRGAMEDLMKGRTTFIATHRLSSIVSADLILVLDEGRLVEMGTHVELLARGGQYAQMCEEQFAKVPESPAVAVARV